MVIPRLVRPGYHLAATVAEKCTSLYGVPTMFIAEWALPTIGDYDLSTVRTGDHGRLPCPAR